MTIVVNGDGTITGISSGGLPDGIITDAELSTNLSASKLTGVLPAVNGSSLTNLPTEITNQMEPEVLLVEEIVEVILMLLIM
jgi:hypothetical protein